MRYTEYEALENALIELKHIAKTNVYLWYFHYKFGCEMANVDWSVVSDIILDIFNDYEATQYQL